MADASGNQAYRVGVDIGGTFTDVVLATADGRVAIEKLLSTPADYSVAVVDGVLAALAKLGNDPRSHAEIVHATTVATNAILQHAGARSALITTEGFKDVLEIGRLRIPALYDVSYDKRPALVPRQHVFEVRERVNQRGEIDVALDPAEVEAIAARVTDSGAVSVAICLLNSFANGEHERAVADVLRRLAPGLDLSVSHEILPRIGEYERTSTTVVNAYVMPTVRHYLRALVDRLHGHDIRGSLLIMRSSGGVMSVDSAVREPVHMVESGPAAGVLAAHRLLADVGAPNLLTFDIGGTTAKASVIENGTLLKTFDYEVGGEMSATSRLTGGGGYPLQIPVIDIAEVGAGGGSIVWVDGGGSLRVGPRSAGADPGPVCYDAGGAEVTVTDANLLLGYLNPAHLAGGLAVRADLAAAAMRSQVAEPLGIPLLEAAYGVHLIANSQMMGAIRAVSTERGRDVRDFTLVAFGGSGPIHAALLARELGIATVIVPPAPGVFSATGLLFTDIEHARARTLYRPLPGLEPATLDAVLGELEGEVRWLFAREGFEPARVRLETTFDMRYWGQNSDLSVTLPAGEVSASIDRLAELFADEHERTFGHRAESDSVMLVQVHVTGRASPALASQSERALGAMRKLDLGGGGGARARDCYFGPALGSVSCALRRRSELAEEAISGPLLIEEFDSVTVVPPGFDVRRDRFGNVVLEARRTFASSDA